MKNSGRIKLVSLNRKELSRQELNKLFGKGQVSCCVCHTSSELSRKLDASHIYPPDGMGRGQYLAGASPLPPVPPGI